MQSMLQVINTLPGRARIKISYMLYNKTLSRYLNAYVDNLYGVRCSSANHYSSTILVEYDIKKTSLEVLKKNIEGAVASAVKNGCPDPGELNNYYNIIKKRDKAKRKFILFGLAYIALKVKHSFFGKFSISSNLRVLQVASAVTLIGGYPLLKRLYKKYSRNIPADSDIILKLAALSLTLLRESSKGVFVIVLKELNDYIKLSADAENSRLLSQSMQRGSGMAWLVKEKGTEVLVPVESLSIGDEIAIHQGEVVPAAGFVQDGKAYVNSLYYSGQPVTTCIEKGSRVYEGFSVLSGTLKVRISELPMSSRKEDISQDQLEISRKVKKYQEAVTPVSFAAAAAGFLISGSTLNALSVLLVLTPSAAGTALSTGMKSCISLLNKHNIYIMNPNILENLTRVDSIVFDKTGTLTYGRMSIREAESFSSDYTPFELLKICAACEADSYHPISVTLQEEMKGSFDPGKVASSVMLPSKGIVAEYDGQRVLIGRLELMEENGVDVSAWAKKYHEYEKKLYTPVLVSINGSAAGIFGMQDEIRPDSFELIKRLKERGYSNITLLTGDSREKAQYLSHKLGIRNVYYDCSYKDKFRIINEMKKHSTVMMVGDGINDVDAMKAADVSVSFASSSCDKIKLHSDCIVFEDNMARLADLMSLCRKSYNSINQTLTISQIYNAYFGIQALFNRFDAFAAKSLNTVNSLMVLLLNKRIEYISPQIK
ncbi:MAG: HAD-IC family P-type ATPase [Clostridia bacterium]|nr:HAD-IC family P-type ATPase [Clostridia bacterium]